MVRLYKNVIRLSTEFAQTKNFHNEPIKWSLLLCLLFHLSLLWFLCYCNSYNDFPLVFVSFGLPFLRHYPLYSTILYPFRQLNDAVDFSFVRMLHTYLFYVIVILFLCFFISYGLASYGELQYEISVDDKNKEKKEYPISKKRRRTKSG